MTKNRLHVATLLLEGGAPFGEVEAAVEVAGRGLADSVAEMKQPNGMDLNVHRVCEISRAVVFPGIVGLADGSRGTV